MADTISPEERLFKVIQQGKLTAGQDRSGSGEKTGGGFERFKRFITAQIAGKTGADSREGLLARIKWPELEPGIVNKVLAVVLVVALGLVAYEVLGKHKDVAVIMEAVSRIKTLPEEDKKKIEPLKALSFYLSEIRKRDIFRANAESPVVENVQIKSESLEKAVESMKLQGISRGDVPKAMILWQNGKDSKMYFLVEGQAIGTSGFKVIKILKNTVTVGDGVEETVLL